MHCIWKINRIVTSHRRFNWFSKEVTQNIQIIKWQCNNVRKRTYPNFMRREKTENFSRGRFVPWGVKKYIKQVRMGKNFYFSRVTNINQNKQPAHLRTQPNKSSTQKFAIKLTHKNLLSCAYFHMSSSWPK